MRNNNNKATADPRADREHKPVPREMLSSNEVMQNRSLTRFIGQFTSATIAIFQIGKRTISITALFPTFLVKITRMFSYRSWVA